MKEKELINRKINKDRSLFTLKYWDNLKLKNYITQVKERISMIANEIDTSIVIPTYEEDTLPKFNNSKFKYKNCLHQSNFKKTSHNSSSPHLHKLRVNKSHIDIFRNKLNNNKQIKTQNYQNTPLYETKSKNLIDLKLNSSKKERNSCNTSETSDFYESNPTILRMSIFKIRKQFDVNLQNLEKTHFGFTKNIIGKKNISPESNERLFNNIKTRSSIIEKYTNSQPPKIKNIKRKKNISMNSEYTDDEVKEIVNNFKTKGLYVTDSRNKIKFFSYDNDNILRKDQYLNKLSEEAAVKYENLMRQNYLQNSKKRYSQENLLSNIDKRTMNHININRIKINAINYDYMTNFKRIVDK
jgi:hypothetical protein